MGSPEDDKRSKIAIIGGGMAALYAYWGCKDAGVSPHDIDLMVAEVMSPAGAMFMYRSPVNIRKQPLTNVLVGSCDTYGYKQWKVDSTTSAHTRFENGKLDRTTDLIYDPKVLMNLFLDMIPNILFVDYFSPESIESLKSDYRAVICSFPNHHTRKAYDQHTVRIPIVHMKAEGTDFTCIYNGLPEVPWVRQTWVPGSVYTEYPHHLDMGEIKSWESRFGMGRFTGSLVSRLDLRPGTPALKPEERREGNLLRVGRMACFDRTMFSHQAYNDAYEFVSTL